jgi:hypothetical protein
VQSQPCPCILPLLWTNYITKQRIVRRLDTSSHTFDKNETDSYIRTITLVSRNKSHSCATFKHKNDDIKILSPYCELNFCTLWYYQPKECNFCLNTVIFKMKLLNIKRYNKMQSDITKGTHVQELKFWVIFSLLMKI